MTELQPAPQVEGIESSLGDLYENAPCGYLSTTLDGVIVRVNETFLTMSGYRREQLLGTQILSILTGGGQLFYDPRDLPVLHLQGEAREVVLTVRHASGDDLAVLVSGVVVNDEQGQPTAIRTAVFPYSGRKEYEQELLAARRLAEASESRLRLLHDALVQFSAADSEEHLAEELAGTVREAFAAPEVSVYLLDDAQRLALAAGTSLMDAPLLADGGPVQRAMSGQKVVSFDEADAADEPSPALSKSMRAARVESAAVVPLFDHQKPLGVLVMFFRRARKLEPQDVELAETLGRQATEVLARLQAERVLERMALHDEVTGLPTRRLIRARVNEAIDAAHVSKQSMAVVTVALDGFKRVNATFGNVAGEDALVEIGGRLADSAGEGDLVGRYSDDEFVIVCPDLDGAGAEDLVDELLTALRHPLQAGSGRATIATNIGVAVYSGLTKARPSSRSLFEGAGQAMYRARSMGKNQAAITTIDYPGAVPV